MPFVKDEGDNCLLTVYVQPRSTRNRIIGLHGEALKISVAAPPVDGKANVAIIAFLAKVLKMAKTSIVMKSGHESRTKRFILMGIPAALAREMLAEAVRKGLKGGILPHHGA